MGTDVIAIIAAALAIIAKNIYDWNQGRLARSNGGAPMSRSDADRIVSGLEAIHKLLEQQGRGISILLDRGERR
jgi:hypothetical protein